MLAVVYLTLTAKPLSLRRLLLLFTFALMAGNPVFAAFHVKHGPREVLVGATAITLLAWSVPLARLAYHAVCFRMIPMEALDQVSGFIRWTYGFVFALVPLLATTVVVDSAHRVAFGDLLRLTVMAGLLGALLENVVIASRPRGVRIAPTRPFHEM